VLQAGLFTCCKLVCLRAASWFVYVLQAGLFT